jgi:hypothetical protein
LVILVFVLPMLTMRLMSEELRSGTIETLMTTPITELEVIQEQRRGRGLPPLETVRTLEEVRIEEEGGPERGAGTADGLEQRIRIEVLGSGFLYKMVRTIVGTLVQVGLGRRTPGWIPELIARRDRRLAGPTAPALGLCLMRVIYARGAADGGGKGEPGTEAQGDPLGRGLVLE